MSARSYLSKHVHRYMTAALSGSHADVLHDLLFRPAPCASSFDMAYARTGEMTAKYINNVAVRAGKRSSRRTRRDRMQASFSSHLTVCVRNPTISAGLLF